MNSDSDTASIRGVKVMRTIYHVIMHDSTLTFLDHAALDRFLSTPLHRAHVVCTSKITDEQYGLLFPHLDADLTKR